MQYIFLSILSIPFLYINYKIVSTDLKEKKIPNRLLWYMILLLPFYYIYTFYYLDINYLFFSWQIVLTLFISFILYSFWIWSAWDAKYLLVLGLFIPHIWVVTFIGNIALLTIIYLLIYFIWFYFWRCLFNWEYSKSLYLNVKNDLREKLNIHLKSWDWNLYKKVIIFKLFKWLITFLLIFVSIRLSRLFLFSEIFIEWWKYNFLVPYIKDYIFYIFIFFIIATLSLIILIKWIYLKVSKNISEMTKLIFIISLFTLLLLFIYYEYNVNQIEIKIFLYRIFTFMLVIYFIFLILRYSYKITFGIAETYYININDLKEWDIVDKEYLIKMFWEQVSLWANLDKWFLSPSPVNYFKKIKNPVDNENIKILNKVYKIVNNFHKNNNEDNNKIKLLNTFAFWWYIFIWFLISFLFWNFIIKYFLEIFIQIIKT